MAKTQYLDYSGLQTLITQIKAADTVVKNYAGDITGKTDKDGKAYTSVQAYLEDKITAAAASSQAENVTVKDTDGHFTGANVEAILAELGVAIELLNDTDATKAGSVAKMIADSVGELKIGATSYTTVKGYVDALAVGIKNLVDASTGDLTNLATTNKTDLVHAINEVKTTADGAAVKVASATAGNFAGLDASGNLTDSGKKASDFVASTSVKATAIADADAETATLDENLVNAAQVVNYVKGKVAGVTGALHFRGIKTATSDITDPAEGDVVIVGTTEYIYDGSKWQELGNEGAWVAKTTTIAGVDLQDNITASEMKAALDIDDIETNLGVASKAESSEGAGDGVVATGLNKKVEDLESLVGEGIEAIPTASITALFTS